VASKPWSAICATKSYGLKATQGDLSLADCGKLIHFKALFDRRELISKNCAL
jgi:hypothetical protein